MAQRTTSHAEVLIAIAVPRTRSTVFYVIIFMPSCSVLNDTYGSLARPLYVYVTKSALAEKDGHTLGFVTWLMERASKLAAYEGFIPLIDANYADGLRKLSAK